MLLELTIAAAVLLVGNIAFYHFDPHLPLWKRIAKSVLTLAVLAAVSHFFGRAGVLIAAAVAIAPIVYIHGIWLPRHGVNGWTGEPREKYHALRGWPPPGR
jgi:hypothetical protein